MITDSEKLKKRSANFTYSETELLCNLVCKYAAIIESKKTDSSSWKEKMEAWQKLTAEYNLENNGPSLRTAVSLKAKYEGIKKDLRKKVSKNKQEMLKTGGGVPQITPLTPYEEIIYNIITLSVEGLPSRFDDDNILQVSEEGTSLGTSTVTAKFPSETNFQTEDETIVFEVVEDNSQDNFYNENEASPQMRGSTSVSKVKETHSSTGESFEFSGASLDPLPGTEATSPSLFTSIRSKWDKPSSIKLQGASDADENRPSTSAAPSIQTSRWNPNLLKTPVSKELKVRQRNKLTKLQAAEKVTILSESKNELVQLQVAYQKKELEFQEQIHELKVKKAEEDLKNSKLEGEIKRIEKQIKEETLKKILNQNSFVNY